MRFVRRRVRRGCKDTGWEQPFPLASRLDVPEVDLSAIDEALREH